MRCSWSLPAALLPAALCLAVSSVALPARAQFSQCPPVGLSPSCAVLITINPNGSLSLQIDPSVPPFDGDEDTLVGVFNNSGATVFGISLSGPGIFGFDGDGANHGSYAGPGTSFSIMDRNTGTVNFDSGLNDQQSLWFSLEGSPAGVKLSRTITLDPGHGGTMCKNGGTQLGGDTGATGPTFQDTEHALALAIGSRLRTKLDAVGYHVVMTRTTAVCPSLLERVNIANHAKSNAFVSIHFNGVADKTVGGSQVWYDPSKDSSMQLATITVPAVAAALGIADRGPKIAGRDGKSLYVLRKTNSRMTAVLAEVAFLSNVGGDEQVMHEARAPDLAATGLFVGIQGFFNQ